MRRFEGDQCGPGSLSLLLNALGDPVSEAELEAALPKAPGGGVLSVDLLLAARQRGFDASLVPGSAEAIRTEIDGGRPVILMLKLLDVPGERRDVYHYAVVDGFDPTGWLFRFQFGDGKVRWARLERLEKSWRAAGHAQLVVRPQGDPDADLRRGVALEQAGRLDEAAAFYRKALAARPGSVRAWVDLGNAESSRGRREDAERAYRRALALSPGDRDGLNNLAWLLLEEGSRLEEAEALAARAASRAGPDRPLAQETLGRIRLARGRCNEAARAFDEALAASEGMARETRAALLEGRGQAQRACGRIDEARASFLEALRTGPSPATARAAEAGLEALAPRP